MRIVAYDTETRGLDWFDESQQAFLVSWADADEAYCGTIVKGVAPPAFNKALREADIIVCHNLSFDAHQLRATTGVDVLTLGPDLHDTDLMSRILLPEGQRKERGGHGLKNLAKTFLYEGATDEEDAIKDLMASIDTTPKTPGAYYDCWRAYPVEMEAYAKKDARYTYDLFTKFNAMMEENPQAARIYVMEREVVPVLIRAEQRGVAVAPVTVNKLRAEYEQRRRNTENSVIKGGIPLEALHGKGSRDKLAEALEEIGVPLHRRTEGGQLKTDQFALAEFTDKYPVLQAFQEWRTSDKFLSTYIEPMVGRTVVHPSFRQIGAWTGRMSCSRPNMQNVPKRAGKEVRGMFVPRTGHAFVVADYSSIEVRLLAYYLNDPAYIELIEGGHDPHAWMAAQIHGGEPTDWEGTPERDVAKNTLFAIVYGAGAPRVSDMNGITKPEAKALISKIKNSLPRFGALSQRVRRKVQATGYVTTYGGRKNPVKRDKAYVGLNALIQGSAADLMKQGLVNVAADIEPFAGHVLLVVHDEVVVECPKALAEDVQQAVEAAMIRVAPLRPTLAVDSSIVTTNYSEA